VGALKKGDVPGFLDKLSGTGAMLSRTHPQAATAFLNALANLPGGMGRLFADPELNQLMVSTGTVERMFDAASKLAEGDATGAMQEVGTAVAKLVSAGPPYVVAGQTVPYLGQDGVKAMTKMFERVVDALPPEVKNAVMQKAAEVAAEAGLDFVPIIGPAIEAFTEAKAIYDDLQGNPPNYLNTSIDSAKLVLQLASVFPPVQPFVQPINTGLGLLEVAGEAQSFISNIEQFKREFTGLAGGPN
jgi:hypothetical protein